MKSKLLAVILSCLFLQIHAELPAPYNSVKEILPFDGSGWYPNAYSMQMLIKSRGVKVVVELGTWLGESARHIATVLPSDGIVYAVDHWLGSVEHHDMCPEKLPTLYEQFLSNTIHANLTDKIIPLRMTTLEAVGELNQRAVVPDLVYVDASHDEESVYADISAYFPLVKGHGIICGDDWGYPGVYKAVERFASENQLTIYAPTASFWMLME